MAFVHGNGYLGDFKTGSTIDTLFNTMTSTGLPFTLAGTPAISVYKDGSKSQTTEGVTLSVDFDGMTGMHYVSVITTDNFYATGQDYKIVLTAGSVNSESVVGYVVGSFSIHNRSTPWLVWEEVLTAGTHNVNNSAGKRLRNTASQSIMDGTVLSATENTVSLDLAASSVNGAYDPALIYIDTGTGAGQCRNIFQYTGATRTCVVDRDWKVIPSTDSTYIIVPDAGREHVNEGLIRAVPTSVTAQLNASASTTDDCYNGQVIFIRSGAGEDQARRVADYDGATQTITVNAAWNPALDTTSCYAMLPTARIIPADIGSGVWGVPAASYTSAGTTGKVLNDLATSASAIETVTDKVDDMIIMDELAGPVWSYDALEYIRTQVWDVPAGWHLTNDTMGGYMNDLKGVSVRLDGMMETAGEAGYRFTELALEQAPGGEAEGLVSRTYTVYARDGRTPVPNIQVWATTDEAGLNRVDAVKMTNDLGQVTFRFNLESGTHVWIWNRSSTVGDEEIV